MSATTVTTTAGQVRGRRSDGVTTWLGVPYTAPPVGPLRFRAPQPVPRWDGVRPALEPGGAAMQRARLSAPMTGLGSSVSEDCLYLNVSSPAADDARRPVLVWLHGGAFTNGSGALYDGRHLAALGDVVVVTVNYRLGVFGFVDLAAVTNADVPSNLGLRDAIAALEWVRENVAAFGGDPARVTVAGESAGSVLVSLLMVAPAARGLFRAAICSSGTYSLNHGEQARTDVAARYAAELRIGPRGGAALSDLPAEQLLAAQVAVSEQVHATTPAAPWFDGDVVPGSLEQARAAVRPDLTLLAGSTRDEMLFFRRTRSDILLTGRAEIASRLRNALGEEHADAVLARYPRSLLGEVRLSTDLNFARPTAHLAERHAAAGGTAFAYRFDAATPWLGACHAADLPYLWAWGGATAFVLRGAPTSARRALAARLQRHWVDFVRDGHPGGAWPVHELPKRRTLVLHPAGDRVQVDPAAERRTAWAGADVMPHP
ncbi:carboxylesterase/lipase family protein [Quadrisphaera sp. DSM 44207]|uniref:carboxylesterase/lipase family protein n=1 Tax=Quadrisphaera sp. DSM 44207 TaxID=1881057 RepID=UPI00088C6BFF|nr:carboxylesterase family protein [Quadrisphaera sp. DSM 44207]SDQ35478.1 para-nitrobenzyl esterase [Quadrisphaera sp. DSM 44207]